MIESWWKALKHQWLYLNSLDSENKLRKLVDFCVDQHNHHLPNSAFKGQTPHEMYSGTGDFIPKQLKAMRLKAQKDRIEKNRSLSCNSCSS